MVDKAQLKLLILEENFPYFSETALDGLCNMYDNLYELASVCCTMKGQSEDIKVGPISVTSNIDMWNRLSVDFYKKYLATRKAGSTTCGVVYAGRSDEY